MKKISDIFFFALSISALQLIRSPVESCVNALDNTSHSGSYAIVVGGATAADPDWAAVVDVLQMRYNGQVFVYEGTNLWDVQSALSEYAPKYIGFVARPSDIISYGGEQYVRNVHQLARALDGDPYGDAIWGIITGYNADDAMRIATGPSGILVSNALLKTADSWLEYFKQGHYFSESEYKKMWIKYPDGTIDKSQHGPTDCSDALVTLLNGNTFDIMVTSGHASQHDWQLHYPFPGLEGFFRSSAGQLYGEPYSGPNIDITSTNPKIYYAPGNCLIGHISDMNCMALAWIHTGGAYQYCGYTVGTWYGYMGWGISEYFFHVQDRFSFAESFYLNSQALVFDLENHTPGTDPGGLNYDRDVVAFYGDPACEARLERSRDPL